MLGQFFIDALLIRVYYRRGLACVDGFLLHRERIRERVIKGLVYKISRPRRVLECEHANRPPIHPPTRPGPSDNAPAATRDTFYNPE